MKCYKGEVKVMYLMDYSIEIFAITNVEKYVLKLI